MRSDPADAPFPCPGCQRPGRPVSVSTAGASGVVIALECATCGRHWEIERQTVGRVLNASLDGDRPAKKQPG